MRTLLRRAAATGVPIGNLAKHLLTTDRLENVHLPQGGILRLKHPSERRPGMLRGNPWLFWPRFCWEKTCDPDRRDRTAADLANRHHLWPRRAPLYGPRAHAVSEDEDETLDLLTKTTGARAAVAHVKKKTAELRGRMTPQV